MKVIFLDIDGVLNSYKFHIDNYKDNQMVRQYLATSDLSEIKVRLVDLLLNIDFNKLYLLKKLADSSGAQIVTTSSWRNMPIYIFVEEFFIKYGLPMLDSTLYLGSRGAEIKQYLETHDVENYVILDDTIFEDYDDELQEHLVLTSSFIDGLEEMHIFDAMYMLEGNAKAC